MSRLLLFLALTASGCVVDVRPPEDARIACQSDADCADGGKCGPRGVCARKNTPPVLALGPIARSTEIVALPLTVFDDDGDEVQLEAFVERGDHAPEPIALTPTSLAASPDGVETLLAWDAKAFFGSGAHRREFRVRLVAHDPTNTTAPLVSPELAFGNDPPIAGGVRVDVPASGSVSGYAVVRFVASDSSADPLRLAGFEVSRAGDFSDAKTVTIAAGAGTAFPSGAIAGLASDRGGIEHSLTWDSRGDAPFDAASVAVRLKLADAFGGVSEWAESTTFGVDNATSPPEIALTMGPSGPSAVSGDVPLSFTIADLDRDACIVALEYSVGGGAFQVGATASKLIGLTPGPHTIVWQSTQLGLTRTEHVRLRVSVSDANDAGGSDETSEIIVDNTLPNTQTPLQVAYVSPVAAAMDIPLSTSIVLVFDHDVDVASLAGRVHLNAPGDMRSPVATQANPSVFNTFEIAASNLLAEATYTLIVDAGVAPHPSATDASASIMSFQSTFTTRTAPDTTPPAAVSSLIVQKNGPTFYQLGWVNPASDFAGAIVLRRQGQPVDPADEPVDGQSYSPPQPLGSANVVAVTTNSTFLDATPSPGDYDYVVYAFDAALNYSLVGRRAPWVTASTQIWCPDESGSFSVTAIGASAQQLWIADGPAQPFASGTLAPPAGAPVGATTPFPVGAGMTVGSTYYLRPVASGPHGTFAGIEVQTILTPAALPALSQPVDVATGGNTSFTVSPLEWTELEVTADTDVAPASELFGPPSPATPSPNVTVTRSFAQAGEYALAVRPKRAGCASPGAWTVSNRFRAGNFRFVKVGGSGDQSGTSPVNAAPTIAAGLSGLTGPADVYVRYGSYPQASQLAVPSGVSLYGGYSDTFQTRNPSGTPSSITGDLNTWLVTVAQGATTATVIDGFQIQNGVQAFAASVGLFRTSPTIKNNVISGGRDGVIIENGAPVIEGNTITPGTVAVAAAIRLTFEAPNALIRYNALDGGLGTTTYGVYVDVGKATIHGNTMTSQTGSTSIGVYVHDNALDGSVISSNVITSPTVGTSTGIEVKKQAFIVNNTVRSSAPISGYATPIHNYAPNTVIANNITFTTGTGTRYCIQNSAAPTVAILQNNLMFDCPNGLFVDLATPYNFMCPQGTPSQFSGCGSPLCGAASWCQGNLQPYTLAAVAFAGATDFHLTMASPIDVRFNGVNAGTGAYGNVTKDRDDAARDCPGIANCYSVGAYEFSYPPGP
ncbi:MAG: Ig-like domain-containing protein [Deltaproteobacteria bacterium]|nr:Ig-like domain-containing protein [Deltaproteobacteria bacterium]